MIFSWFKSKRYLRAKIKVLQNKLTKCEHERLSLGFTLSLAEEDSWRRDIESNKELVNLRVRLDLAQKEAAEYKDQHIKLLAALKIKGVDIEAEQN